MEMFGAKTNQLNRTIFYIHMTINSVILSRWYHKLSHLEISGVGGVFPWMVHYDFE